MKHLTQHRAFFTLITRITLIVLAVVMAGCGTIATPAAPVGTTSAEITTATSEAGTSATAAPTVEGTASEVATPAATGQAAGRMLVIGDVSGKPTQSIDLLQPVADYLAANLKDQGISGGTVKVDPDFKTIAADLKSGAVDIIFQTPYPSVLLADAAGAQSILRRWRNGDAEYYTVIFARADSGMKTIQDLKGHMMAVQDEYSTSAYMLPLSYALQAGLKITKKDKPGDPVAADELGYTNSNSDDNTLQWVISKKVDLGATDNRSYEKIPKESRDQLVVLVETDKIPRGVVVVRPGLDPAFVDALKAVFLNMDKADQGKAVLEKFQKTTKFDELPGGADQALAHIKDLAKLLQQK